MTLPWRAALFLLVLPPAAAAQQATPGGADTPVEVRQADSTIRVSGADPVLVVSEVGVRLARVARRLATGAVGLKVLAGRSGGSGSHAEGRAVDLTLVDLSRGTELPMGGTYPGSDSASAAPAPTGREARYRELLRRVMVEEGFVAGDRWWHFQLQPLAISR